MKNVMATWSDGVWMILEPGLVWEHQQTKMHVASLPVKWIRPLQWIKVSPQSNENSSGVYTRRKYRHALQQTIFFQMRDGSSAVSLRELQSTSHRREDFMYDFCMRRRLCFSYLSCKHSVRECPTGLPWKHTDCHYTHHALLHDTKKLPIKTVHPSTAQTKKIVEWRWAFCDCRYKKAMEDSVGPTSSATREVTLP